MKVSIIIPVIRPKNIPRLSRMIVRNAGIPGNDLEILTEEDTKRIGAPKMVKRLTDKAANDLVMFIGDDCEPQKNFVKFTVNAMKKLPDGWGLVGMADKERPGDHAPTHWLGHKKLLEYTGGEFFHTGYIHQFCDNELCLWATCLGRYVLEPKAVISHKHDGFKNKKKSFRENLEASKDKDYKRVYSQQVFDHDRQLFEQRKDMIINATRHIWSSLGKE